MAQADLYELTTVYTFIPEVTPLASMRLELLFEQSGCPVLTS